MLLQANPDDQNIKKLLTEVKTIAVVGLSPKPERDSNQVARYLKESGYTIVPVNPKENEILGEKCYASLLDIPFEIDMVDVFRKSEFVPQVVEDTLKTKAKALWLQLGVSHFDAGEKARKNGLIVIQNSCLMVDHKRLF
ncbi:CoA-binding protein [Dethiosulfatarculus sandiegensis]|uniref:CoA-binding protein n=1 Tax=Dethiosulfatarculus sandiegensis TaxID=1429043 RepID=A0A0D2HUT8_9BACT|nr:CoA-binding protein [Dethiosulfatarculus sandiegensis]KIX14188.1 CoA-binding protein [Dethiosulfatarculus sandiegensis]